MKKVSGSPLPLGVTYKNGRANLHGAPEGKHVSFCSIGKEKPACCFLCFSDRIGSVCYMAVDGLKEEAYEYNYDIDGESVTELLCKGTSGKESMV